MSRYDETKHEEYTPYLGQPRACIVCGASDKREWARDGIFKAVQCGVCSMVWMDPFLSPEGLQKYYDNYIQYRLNDPLKMQQRDRMYELDAQFLEQFIHEGKLLDVGASAGYFLEKLSPSFDKYGIEVDEKAIAEAQRRSPLRDRITLQELGRDSFEPESFDVITMRGVIEHVPDPAATVERVSQLLKPGGYMYITATPNVDSFCADLYREKWNLWDPFQHIYHFSVPTLTKLAKRFGLSLVAQSFPYTETPYANPPEDHAKVLQDYSLISQGRRTEVTRSSAFWGNMLTVLFRKGGESVPSRQLSAAEKYMQKFQKSDQPYVIAEIGTNHNGSVEIAKKLIDVAVVAGADAAKFQKRIVEQLAVGATLDAADERFPEFGSTYRQVREHLEFDEAEYKELKEYCEAKGIDFLCTAFDIPAADFLLGLGVESFKIASASLTNLPLLKHLAATGKPAIISTGMSELDEVDQAVAIYKAAKTPFILMHCVASYPTPANECNLVLIDMLRQRYEVPIGYSGHEMGYAPTLGSVALGAVAVERHITLDKTLTGFDHKISLEPQELIEMIRDIKIVAAARGTAVKKVLEPETFKMKQYHVSMVALRPIMAGTKIEEHMITYKNPGTGIAPKDAALIIEHTAKQDIPADTLFTTDMVEG